MWRAENWKITRQQQRSAVGQCIQLQDSSYSEDPVLLLKNDFQEGLQADQWCGFTEIYGKFSQTE